MRNLSRIVLFVLMASIFVCFYMPLGNDDFAGKWGGGTFGFSLNRGQNPIVDDLAADSPAARAGVRNGDVYIEHPFSIEWTEAAFPKAGDRRTLHFRRPNGDAYAVTLTAEPVPGFTWWSRLSGILAIVPATVFIVVAAALVFLRPSVMTWSFFAFASGYFSTGPTFHFFHSLLPRPVYLALTFVLSTFVGNFAVMPLLPFVIRFPSDHTPAQLRTFDRIIWLAIAIAFVGYSYLWYAQWQSGMLPWWSTLLENWLPLAVFALAAALLVKRYKHAPAEIKQRFAFLTIGLIVAFAAYAVYFVPGVPFAVTQIIGYAVVIMPICVAYAALRARVIDVNFVLNRALSYGLVSLFVIALVSLIDWAFSQLVSQRHLAIVGELAATICVGLLLDRINKLMEAFVETVLFRRRRLAEDYLVRAARALPYATDEAAIADGLTQVPVDGLRLSAAAVYRRSLDGSRFEGFATSHDTPIAPPGFDLNHLLVRMLESSEANVWLDELRTHLDADNSAIYVLATPVTVRHDLVAFTLYGAHRNGAQIDPEEVKLLDELAREASRAFDHVDAVRTRERYSRLEPRPETA